ncbi:MAG: hypothetical protein K2W82_09980 [Candidatus Obscuribacterales bacterium]|nr:hypothetical protein [Candidatus Obscuribacterales bacterium]
MRTVFRRFLGIAGTVLILFQGTGQMAVADEASGGDAPHCESHPEGCAQTPSSLNLDLSSTAASVVFSGGHTNPTSVNIDVAGTAQTVNPGQMLTPAQAVAAYQMLHSGVQNILLGMDGSAVGGSMVIGSQAVWSSALILPTCSIASSYQLASLLSTALLL